MAQYTLTAAQQEAFRKMNQDAQIYGQTQVTDHEQQSFNRDGFATMGPIGDRNMETSKRIQEMMKVDVQSAEALREAYPELYNNAQTEMKALETTANMSAGEKIKQHDFFGSKRKAAREQVERIKTNRQKLQEQRIEDALSEVRDAVQARRAEVAGESSTNVVSARKKSVLSDSGSKAYEMADLDRLLKSTDSEAEIFVRSNEMTTIPRMSADGVTRMYGSKPLYRDHMRVLTKPLERVTVTREKQSEFLDAQYVLQNKRHLTDAAKGPDGKPTEVPNATMLKAFDTVYSASITSIGDIDSVFSQHPLWDQGKSMTAEQLLKEYGILQSTYQKAQATDQTFTLLFDSPVFAQQDATVQKTVFDSVIRVRCYREVIGAVATRVESTIMKAHNASSEEFAIQSMATVRQGVVDQFGGSIHGRKEKYPNLFG